MIEVTIFDGKIIDPWSLNESDNCWYYYGNKLIVTTHSYIQDNYIHDYTFQQLRHPPVNKSFCWVVSVNHKGKY